MVKGETAAPAESSTPSLEYIFHPRSVAVVGASRAQPGGPATNFVLALKEMGFPLIYPVNPKYQELDGLRCYSSLREIQGPVDHVISSVPAHITPTLVEDCIAKGVKTLHFFTAGFSETGEPERAELEAQVIALAKAAGIRVLGPNCMGLYVPRSRLTFAPGFPSEAGNVALISQSGGNASDMVFTAAARGIRFSKVISYGNASDIDESELLEYLAQDPETKIITAYIEGVKDGRRFFAALRRAAAAKPVLVLKGGRTEAGARAAYSHTASLAGSIQVFDALCRQVGALRAYSIEELADLTVAFLHLELPSARQPRPLGPRVGVVGVGGGSSVFAADEIDGAGLSCPVLPEDTQAQLREFIPVAGTSVRNPIDATSVSEPEQLERILRIVALAENVDLVMYHTNVGWGWRLSNRKAVETDPHPRLDQMVEQLVRTREAVGKPVVLVARPPLDTEAMARIIHLQARCHRAGIPLLSTIPRAASALAKLLAWREGRNQP